MVKYGLVKYIILFIIFGLEYKVNVLFLVCYCLEVMVYVVLG